MDLGQILKEESVVLLRALDSNHMHLVLLSPCTNTEQNYPWQHITQALILT